jgi:hypothetical protein
MTLTVCRRRGRWLAAPCARDRSGGALEQRARLYLRARDPALGDVDVAVRGVRDRKGTPTALARRAGAPHEGALNSAIVS